MDARDWQLEYKDGKTMQEEREEARAGWWVPQDDDVWDEDMDDNDLDDDWEKDSDDDWDDDTSALYAYEYYELRGLKYGTPAYVLARFFLDLWFGMRGYWNALRFYTWRRCRECGKLEQVLWRDVGDHTDCLPF
jgi:hypothetical protein